MMRQKCGIHVKNRVLDIVKLPEPAREELFAFYEFLVYKYQKRTDTGPSNKQRILSKIFDEANGVLPDPCVLDREALHER
jgi:hypothetical protein